MILASQFLLAHWHEQIGDPTLADSILGRLVHNAYRLELTGESMRKKRVETRGGGGEARSGFYNAEVGRGTSAVLAHTAIPGKDPNSGSV